MTIGIYSGTFDPIHEGHILFADVAAEQFGIDKILLVPEPVPRYKSVVGGIAHRQQMAALGALSASSDVVHHSLPGIDSHTIHGVIEQVYEAFPEDEYFIIMGGDVFQHVGKWGEREDEDGSIRDIADKVGFVVGIESMDQLPALQEVADKNGLNVRFIEVPVPGMSSRNIRSAIKNGEPPKGLNDDVAKFIESHELYR